MAELTLRIKAEYESAVACREELRRVEQEMKKLNENSSPQEIERLTKRYAELTAKWENSMALIGKAGAYVKEAFSGIGNTIKQSIDVTKNLGSTTKTIEEAATKRLQLEENILTTLEAQKKVAETQRNNASEGLARNKNTLSRLEDKLNTKYQGKDEGFYDEADQKLLQQGREAVANWSKAWDDANVKVQVYDGLIEESLERQEKLNNAIDETKNVYKGFADTVESSSTKIFISEDIFNRYDELAKRIQELKKEITDISAGDDIDVSQLQKLQDELASNQEEFRTLDETARHAAEVLGSTLGEKVSVALNRLYGLNAEVRKAQSEVGGFEQKLEEAKRELMDAKDPKAITKAREKVDELSVRLDVARDKLSQFKADQKDAIKEIENLSNKLDESTKSDDEGGGITDLASGLAGKIAAIAGIGLGLNELKDFFSKAKEWREYFQDIESSMKVFLGSAEKGAEFTAKLKDYAYYNMFEFSDLAAASQQMISYGHNVESIIPRLDQLSNVATGTHGSLMELVDAYNRAKATGVVDARGVQSWAVKGVMIRDVLRDMGEVTAGTTITFEQLNKVLDKVTGEGGQFHDLMLSMMDNISAESGQLEDNLAAMYSEVGEKFEGVFVKWLKLQSAMAEGRNSFASDELLDFGAEKANEALDFLLENWQKIISVIKDAVVVYGSYRAALITINAIEKAHTAWVAFKKAAIEASTMATTKESLAKAAETAAEVANTAATNANTVAKGQNASATMLVTHAFQRLAAVVAANPYTIAAAAIAALAYATYAAYDGILTQEEAQRMLNSAAEDFNDTMKEQEQQDRSNISVIQDKTASLLEQTKAYRALTAEREIFAQFSKDEIANMSSDQINSLLAEDTARKNEDRIRNQVEAAKELQQIFSGKGAAWAYAQDEDIEKVVEKFKLLPEYAEKLKDSIGWATNLGDWADELVNASNKELQDYLVKEAEAGVVEGFKKGFSNQEVQASASQIMSDYSKAIEESTSETEKQIAEAQERIARLRSGEEKTANVTEKNSLINGLNKQIEALQKTLVDARAEIGQTFRGTLSQQVLDAQTKVEALEHSVAKATGTKKIELQAELQNAKDDRNTLQSIMKLIEAGKLDTELVVNITRDAENAQIGDEALVTIGEDYKKIDDVAQDVMSRIDEAKKKYESLAEKSDESTQKMIEDFGLTADSIDSDFDNATTKIKGDIDTLQAKINDVKDDGERRKLQLEIDRKEQQLAYIDTLKENLKNLCRDPFNIKLDIKALIPDWLKQLLSKYAGIKFDEEIKKDESQRAQEEGKNAKGNIDAKNANGPTKKTGAQWKSDRNKALRQDLAEINKQLKQPLEEKEYEELIKRKSQIESELKKGNSGTKDALQRRQRDYDQYLKNREQQLAQERKAENAAVEADIAREENKTIRERKERENRFRIQEQQIAEQIESYKKANVDKEKAEWSNKKENKDKIWADTAMAKDIKENGYKNVALTEAQEKEINAIREKYGQERLRYYKDELEKQAQSDREYYKAYGTSQQKMLAIAEEFAIKIREAEEAGNKGEVLKLKAEQQKVEGNFRAEELLKGIDFSRMVDGVGGVVRAMATKTYNDIQEYKKTDQYKSSKFEEKKAISELEQQMIAKGGAGAASPFSLKAWDSLSKATKKYQDSLLKLQVKTQAHTNAVNKQKEAEEKLDKAQKGTTEYLIALAEAANAAAEAERTKAEQEEAEQEKNDSEGEVNESSTRLKQGMDNFNTILGQITSGTVSGLADGVANIIAALDKDDDNDMGGLAGLGKIGGIISAILAIVDALGAEPTKLIDDLLTKVAAVIEGVISELWDIVAAIIEGIGNIIGSIGTGIASWFTGEDYNSNRAEVEKENKRLTMAMQVNTEAINRLTKAMENSTPTEATKYYEQAKALIESNERNAIRQMTNNAYMYDGGHSLNKDFGAGYYHENANGQTAPYFDPLFDIFNKRLEAEGYEKKSLIEEIFKKVEKTPIEGDYTLGGLIQSLTAGDWKKLYEDSEGRKLMKMLGEDISEAEDEGNYNGMFGDIMNLINEYGDAYDDLIDKFNESITHISFDSMYSSFVSSLMDMDKKASDFANDFEGYIRNAIYQSLAAEQLQPLLKEWYGAFAAYLKDDGKITDAEINRLRRLGGTYTDDEGVEHTYQSIDAITDSALDLRDTIEQLGLYNGKNREQQSATANSIQNISYDQADAISGILLSHTIIFEQIKSILEKWSGESAGEVAGKITKVVEDNAKANDTSVKVITTLTDEFQKAMEGATPLESDIMQLKDAIGEAFNSIPIEEIMASVGDMGTAEMSILNASVELLYAVGIEHRDIAADSRDILAGMAIHVEEIRDGMVDTLVPRIKNIDNELVRVRKVLEEQ